MKTFITTSFAVAALVSSGLSAQTFKTDPGHTEVRFGWSHAGVSRQHAEFTQADGTLNLNKDNVEASSLTVTIAADSVHTGVESFDGHIKGARFFDVAGHPEITFVSTGIKRTGDKTAEITGDLTIKGKTNPVTLNATLTHEGPHPLGSRIAYYQGDWVAFNATATIDHMAFGVGPFPTGPIALEIDTEMKATN